MTRPNATTPEGRALGRQMALKLEDIANRIHGHLTRFARDDPGGKRFYEPIAYRSGNALGIRYINYQYDHRLTKADAAAYLEWLDAGNVGRHFMVGRSAPPPATLTDPPDE